MAHYDLQYLSKQSVYLYITLNLINTELNPICHLLTLLGSHPIFHIGRIRVNEEKYLFSVTSMVLSKSEITDLYLQHLQCVAVRVME